MKASIIGMGWATPLGRGLETVWQAVRDGRRAAPGTMENPFSKKTSSVLRVPEDAVKDVAAFPRLRRSSVISHYAVAAAADAAKSAGLDGDQLARTALIYATSDGGVAYTRRFYADIVERGEGAGSPLLFPETVYNAPTSHIAARLGLDGEALTLVGDSAAGMAAVRTGCELLATGVADFCLVATAQELDWLTCEAYARWELISPEAAFAEGAAAIVLAREGGCGVQIPHAGLSFSTNVEAAAQFEKILRVILTEHAPGLVVSTDSGTSFGAIEKTVLARLLPEAERLAPKFTLGESLACSTLQQVIIGALAIRDAGKPLEVLIPAIGFNGQTNALILTGEDGKA